MLFDVKSWHICVWCDLTTVISYLFSGTDTESGVTCDASNLNNTLNKKVGLEEERFVSLEEIFVFDLDMTTHPAPTPCDGEVEGFELLSCEEIMSRGQDVKPDVQLVVAECMLRHGQIRADQGDEIALLELVRGMHPAFPGHVMRSQALL
jgi:hypothetical protein